MRYFPFVIMLVVGTAPADDLPKVLDERLKLELIAEAPVVRTPTGIAIDDKGRVYVVESHTHFPPKDYDGPKHDRILRFEKKGEKYESSVFFAGGKHTMGIGFHPNGWLYIARRNVICRVKDKNDNGEIDDDTGGEHDCLVVHQTKGDYPHNGLSGFAFDFAGNVYFGQGENLGVDYKVIGQDGVELAGGGEGGNIYCIDAEGKKLRRVATGFWNPFHLYMDPFGRLFTVDNDPDSRPPCRLLHVVEGGDYGYRFRNGRKGTHPFTSWNGELPGTLTMVSGTGEAPSGVIEWFGNLLVTSWGDHRIEQYKLQPRGASFTAVMKPLVVGGESFRPVGISESGKDLSVWFTDWVDKSYQLHGKGALWRLKHKEGTLFGRGGGVKPPETLYELEREGKDSRVERRALLHLGYSDPVRAIALGGFLGSPPPIQDDFDAERYSREKSPVVRYAATRRLDPSKHRDRLLELVGDPDPFIQQAARWALKPAAEELASFAFDKEKRPATRLGVALVLSEANSPSGQKRIPELLEDSDPPVRFVAIKWIGEQRLKEIWKQVQPNLDAQIATRQELEAYLATSAFLSDEKYDPGKEARGEDFVVKMLLDKQTSPERQALLLRMLRPEHPALNDELLKKWIDGEHAGLRLAALQNLSQRSWPQGFLNLGTLSKDTGRPVEERLEAIAAMALQPGKHEPALKELLNDKHPLIATQAGRTLRTDERLAAAHSIAFGPEGRPLATNLAEWQKVLDKQPGDPKSGAFVFHHAVAQCSRCHEVEGRGASIGPNLTGIGKSISRERLIQSILQPSKEIAPQFAVWELVTNEGKVLKGMYVGEEVDGTVIYADEKGKTFKLHPRNVESRTQVPTSIMPDGLAYRLTDQELRDLLAYLGSN